MPYIKIIVALTVDIDSPTARRLRAGDDEAFKEVESTIVNGVTDPYQFNIEHAHIEDIDDLPRSK